MKFVFSKLNSAILILAILITVVAYIIMGTGDKTISPILLIICYVILFPLAIMIGAKKNNNNTSQTE